MSDPTHHKTAKKFNLEAHAHFLTFSCHNRMPLLTNDLWRTWLADSIHSACKQFNFAIWAYVFMPEHVHLLLKPRLAQYDLSKFEKSLKLSCSKKVINDLKRHESPLLHQLRVQERPGKSCFRFWQEGGGHDINIWTMAKAIEKARYCHLNPLKRRLVRDPADWRWSSFRWLELGSRKDEPVLVDDWDECLTEDTQT